MRNAFIIILSILSIRVFAQHTNSLTIDRTDTHSASLNLKNTIGLWHLSGPRSYESNNNFSLMWNGGNGFERFLTVLDDGKVGIGTSTPTSKFHVQGDISIFGNSGFYLKPNETFDNLTGHFIGTYSNGEGHKPLVFRVNSNNRMVINTSGFVGINTSDPVETLQLGDRWTFHNGGHKIIGYNYDYNSGDKRIVNDEVAAIRFTDAGDIRFLTSGSDVAGSSIGWSYTLVLKNDGRVGIGVENPSDKLTVDGRIRSEEIKVEIINGPDYVFDSDYELRTLKETKEYINENKHLPEIPSAKEMEAHGIELGDMNMRLLKKIEELTLHQIQLMEEMNAMKKELQKLKNMPEE